MQSMKVESAQHFNLYSFEFSDFDLTEDDTCQATLRMFIEFDLINKFHIPYKVSSRLSRSRRLDENQYLNEPAICHSHHVLFPFEIYPKSGELMSL